MKKIKSFNSFETYFFFILQKKTLNRIIDLNIRRSIGAISSIEYKRYRLLNEINQIGYAFNKSSNYPHFIDPMNFEVIGHEHANITSIETDPREYRWYVFTLYQTYFYVHLFIFLDFEYSKIMF